MRCEIWLPDELFVLMHVELLGHAAGEVAMGVDNGHVHEEVRLLQDKLAKETLYRKDDIPREDHFEEIVGDRFALKKVIEQAEIVSPIDSTLLILGKQGPDMAIFGCIGGARCDCISTGAPRCPLIDL